MGTALALVGWFQRGRVRPRDASDGLRGTIESWLTLIGEGARARPIGEELLAHPDFPELRSAIETLSDFDIPIRVVRCAPEAIDQLPAPFVATLSNAGMVSFAAVSRVYEQVIHFGDARDRWKTMSREYFLASWSGIALVLHPPPALPPIHRSLIPNSEPTSWISKAAPALAGLFAWAGIVATTLDAARLGRRLCSEGCETVRESRPKKVFEETFGGLRIADLGWIFFLGSLSALALGALSGRLAGLMPILAGLSAVASLGSLYLVDLQLRRLRAWCPLCMAVHVVVWAQTALLFASSSANGPTPADAALALFAFGWPALAVTAALPTRRASAGHGRDRLAHLRLRRRPSVVRALLAESPRLQLPPAQEGGRLGSPTAPAQLDLFETPGCRRCEERLAEARELLDRFPERLSVVVHTLDAESGNPSGEAGRWLEENQIRGVSPVFLDGRQLPESLEVQDLQFFVRRVEMTV